MVSITCCYVLLRLNAVVWRIPTFYPHCRQARWAALFAMTNILPRVPGCSGECPHAQSSEQSAMCTYSYGTHVLYIPRLSVKPYSFTGRERDHTFVYWVLL